MGTRVVGAAVTALPIPVAGDLPLEKRVSSCLRSSHSKLGQDQDEVDG